MKIVNKLNLEVQAALDYDPARVVMSGLFLGEEHSITTDGKMAIRVKYPDVDPEQLPAFVAEKPEERDPFKKVISQDFIKKLLKVFPNGRSLPPVIKNILLTEGKDKIVARCTDLESDVEIAAVPIDSEFPDVEKILNEENDEAHTMTLSVEVLDKIVSAMKKSKADAVTLKLSSKLLEERRS